MEAIADVVMPAPAPTPRRIVLQHPDGIFQILGVTTEQPAEILMRIKPGGEQEPINLVACKRSFYLYRIVMSPSEAMVRFHENQK